MSPRTLLLLASDRLGLALAGARIGMGALATDRQALAMAKPAIAGQSHQPLDVHRHLAPKITFDDIIGVDGLADLENFLIGEVLHTPRRGDAELGRYLSGLGPANAMDVGKRDFDALVGRDI